MIRNPEILNLIERLAYTHQPLRLVNEYKGLPVIYDALVVEARSSEVVLKVHRYQAICMQAEKQTFLETHAASAQLKGIVGWVNFRNETAGLTNILYAADTIGDRKHVRVEPGDPVTVTLASRHRNFQGRLADLSVAGVGVYTISAMIYNPVYLKRGATVQLRMELPGGDSIEFPGNIQYVSRREDVYRLGIKTTTPLDARSLLEKYIERRQVELREELEQAWQRAFAAA